MQPLATICIRRPFHWGIVIIADAESGNQIPDVDPEKAVSSNEQGLVALIRHAQDVDSFEGEFEWAEAQVLVRLLSQPEPPSADRREVFRGRLLIASGRISVGDADGEVVHPAHEGWNELIVTVASHIAVSDLAPEELRIDFIPADLARGRR